jgi:hypothetical protein
MLKWLVTVFLALVILSAATPLLRRFRLGRLPGDFQIPVRGRVYYIPFATTVVLSLLVWLIGRLL